MLVIMCTLGRDNADADVDVDVDVDADADADADAVELAGRLIFSCKNYDCMYGMGVIAAQHTCRCRLR